MKRRVNIYLSIVIILLITIVNTSCSKTTANMSIKVATASKGKINTNMNITGALVPFQTVNVSAKISGVVQNVNTDVGNSVKAGDTLITLDTKELNAQLKQAEAAVATNQANFDKVKSGTRPEVIASEKAIADGDKTSYDISKKNYEREKQLFQSGNIAQADLEQAEQKLSSAKAKYDSDVETLNSMENGPTKSDINAAAATVNQAQAAVNYINVQMENTTINGPISGIVINRNINPGEVVSPGGQLLTIADTSMLKLKATVSQQVIKLLQLDQSISIFIDIYPNKEFKGKIDKLGPIAVNTGQYFPIEISIQNPGDIKAGLSAHASIDLDTNEGIIVPAAAVVQNKGQNYVFVIKSGKASKRIVTIGLKNDKEIMIEKGLDVGEQVAITNTNNLLDNMTVNIN